MSRNQVFCDAVLDVLGKNQELATRDIYPLVQDLMPDWCCGDWKHDVQNAQQFLKNRGRIAFEPTPGYTRRYLWKIVS